MSFNKIPSVDYIIGLHGIVEALGNPHRSHDLLYGTDEGLRDLKKICKLREDLRIERVSKHDLQDIAKKEFQQHDLQYARVPSGLLLRSAHIEMKDPQWLMDKVLSGDIRKIFCLDQITDVHNGAAIMRTASFYGVDAIVVGQKGGFRFAPSFFRIASGATEHVPLVVARSLSRIIKKLADVGVPCIGFSEHAEKNFRDSKFRNQDGAMALVVGAEGKGISNAVGRLLSESLALHSQGKIKSLNVSVASAIIMEMFFHKDLPKT